MPDRKVQLPNGQITWWLLLLKNVFSTQHFSLENGEGVAGWIVNHFQSKLDLLCSATKEAEEEEEETLKLKLEFHHVFSTITSDGWGRFLQTVWILWLWITAGVWKALFFCVWSFSVFSYATTSGHFEKIVFRTNGTWRVWTRCVCGNAGSIRPTAQTSNCSLPTNTRMAFLQCAFVCELSSANSWCKSYRSRGSHRHELFFAWDFLCNR